MSSEIYSPPVALPEEALGTTLSEARTNYVVSAMSQLTLVKTLLTKNTEGNRITARLESLPDVWSLTRQYSGMINDYIKLERNSNKYPLPSPEDLLRKEDELRRKEITTFANVASLKLGFVRNRRLKRAAKGIRPVLLGWAASDIALSDAIEARTIHQLHHERQELAKILN